MSETPTDRDNEYADIILRKNIQIRKQQEKITALEAKLDKTKDGDCCTEGCIKCDARKVLAETQKPFGIWHVGDTEEESDFFLYKDSGDVSCEHCIKLYTTPPSREWVGLSDEDKVIIAFDKTMPIEAVIAVTEAKLKEKNSA